MRRFEQIPSETDMPTLYFSDEPRFLGGRDILRNLEDINHEQNPRNH